MSSYVNFKWADPKQKEYDQNKHTIAHDKLSYYSHLIHGLILYQWKGFSKRRSYIKSVQIYITL